MKHAYFQANAALIAAIAVSTEATRYYLQGILVEPNRAGGVNLVATDGSRLIAVYDQHGFASESMIVRIPQRKLKEKGERNSHNKRMVVVRYDDTGSRMDIMDVPATTKKLNGNEVPFDVIEEANKLISRHLISSETNVLIDGTFPDWRRVLPNVSIPKKGMASVNPKYLKDFILPYSQGNGWFEPSSNPSLFTMQNADAQSPGQILYSGSLSSFVYGVLMPMRSGEFSRPAFLDSYLGSETPPLAEPVTAAIEAVDNEVRSTVRTSLERGVAAGRQAAEATIRNPLEKVAAVEERPSAEIHVLPQPATEEVTADTTQRRRRHRLPTAAAA